MKNLLIILSIFFILLAGCINNSKPDPILNENLDSEQEELNETCQKPSTKVDGMQ